MIYHFTSDHIRYINRKNDPIKNFKNDKEKQKQTKNKQIHSLPKKKPNHQQQQKTQTNKQKTKTKNGNTSKQGNLKMQTAWTKYDLISCDN